MLSKDVRRVDTRKMKKNSLLTWPIYYWKYWDWVLVRLEEPLFLVPVSFIPISTSPMEIFHQEYIT